MLARLRTVWEGISTSLWFLPALVTLGAIALAWLTLSLPIATREGLPQVWWLHSGTAEDASNLLSSLLTSMITMATLAISITMVVLALAAGQLGPRLIRSFMADKRTQAMLGVFLATIVYLVLVLRVVSGATNADSVPHLAITFGTALVLICIFILLFFVHHLARSIVADTMVQRVGRDLDLAVERMLPDAEAADGNANRRALATDGGDILRLTRGGYVQTVNYAGLVQCAREADAVVVLNFRPGQHILPCGEHGRFRSVSVLDERTFARLGDCVVLGNQRTAAQDLEFAVRQLVEIALRALSPGVNDPFTAIAVIDRLGASLALVMRRGNAQEIWTDADGTIRVVGKATTFRGIVDAAFNQIRQSGEGNPAILIRILATLGRLVELARNDEQRRVLMDHVKLVSAAGKRSVSEPYDLDAIQDRAERAHARLEDGSARIETGAAHATRPGL